MKTELNKLINCDQNQEIVDLRGILNPEIDTIETGCFAHLDNVKIIKLPDTVKWFSRASFIDMPALESVFALGDTFFDDKCFLGCPNLIKKSLENFSEVSAKSVKSLKFFIPDYQRGYKWGKEEVNNLLEDLYSNVNSDEMYALQPLVVKEMVNQDKEKIHFNFDYSEYANSFDNNYVEVIDGQQRLTTLNLILRFIYKNYGENDQDYYKIFYQSKRYSDRFFIAQAEETIKDWFIHHNLMKKNGNIVKGERESVDNLRIYIENKVFFFFYKISNNSTESAYELFENINKSIRLTNAELFKAFLLNSDNVNERYLSEIKRIAFEWDQYERRMNDEEFWAFIFCDEYEGKTKIDLLLDVFAKYIAETEAGKFHIASRKEDPLYSFEILKGYFNNKCKDPREWESRLNAVSEIWNELTDVFNFFMRMYSDYFLYHFIGFLRHSELYKQKMDLAEMYIKYKKDKTNFSEFKKYIFETVKAVFTDIDIAELSYIRDKMALRDVFLYFNIWETMKNKRLSLRFPFFAHKNTYIMTEKGKVNVTWQIEHINPRSVKKIDDKEVDISDISKAYLGKDGCKSDWHDFENEVERLKEDTTAHFNKIWNLCLLDSYTNEKYKDSPFNIKKAFIVRFDSSSTYIPISTKQIFLKALDDNTITVDELFKKQPANYIHKNLWTIEEQDNYFAQLTECLKFDENVLED